MDKNTITGIALIFLIFLGFSLYNNQKVKKAFDAEIEYADSLYMAGSFEAARESYIKASNKRPKDQRSYNRIVELNNKLGVSGQPQQPVTAITGADTAAVTGKIVEGATPDSMAFGIFSGTAKGENEFYTIENDRLVLTVSSRGGRIYSATLKDYQTYDTLPVVLFNGDSTVFGYKFFTADNKAVRTNDLYFKPENYTGPIVVTSQAATLTMRLLANNGASIDYIYTVHPGEYMVDFETKFNSMGSIIPANTTSLTLDWKMYVPQQEQGRQNEDTYTGLKYKVYQEGVEGLGSSKAKQKKATEATNLMKTDWIAYKDQFFSSVLISGDYFLNASVSSTNADPTSKYLRFFESEIGVPFTNGENTAVKMKMYYG
ncbi:MAG: membrane protein insertase YidC, partial [Bacteroidales bacterium]